MTADREAKVKLDRSLNDDCRALRHGECGHIGSGGGLRTSYVVVCSCACHDGCSSLDVPLDELADACTCHKTRIARMARAQRVGIKDRKQWQITRGSADTPDGEFVVSVGFLIALAVTMMLFVGSIVVASWMSGAVSTVGVIVAVVTGLFLAWIVVLVVFVRFVVGIIRRGIKGGDDARRRRSEDRQRTISAADRPGPGPTRRSRSRRRQ